MTDYGSAYVPGTGSQLPADASGSSVPYGAATGTTTNTSGTIVTPGAGDPTAAQTLMAELKMNFPWIESIGLDVNFFQELVATSASADEIVTKLRQQPQYKARFPGLWRQDGSMRMNESEYLQTEKNYRQVFAKYGYADQYTSPASLKEIFDSEQDANELEQRLGTYTELKTSGQSTIDAFYVYAGLDITTDDLYAALVDPSHRQSLLNEYAEGVAHGTGDYDTFITRVTQLGLTRTALKMKELVASGAVTPVAGQAVSQVDPNLAKAIMDALYTGAGEAADAMNLNDLLTSFELAAIGSAAKGAGLTMPTKQRALELRAAGIDRSKAVQAYQQFGVNGSRINEAAQRLGGAFTQKDWEDAAMLGNSDAQARLEGALAKEDAAGKDQGGFQFNQDRTGRFTQQGFRQV